MTDIPYLPMFDVRTWLDHNHIPYAESGKNIKTGWIGIKCLWCPDGDPSNHLGINPHTMGISCWRCEESGTILKLIMSVLRVDLDTACNVVRDYSLPTDRIQKKQCARTIISAPKSNVDLMKNFTRDMRNFHRNFLESRRYDSDEVYKKYNLYFAGPVGDFALRIIIPIFHEKRIVNFVGRTAKNQEPPYKNCPDSEAVIHIKNTLYGIDNCKKSTIIVVEGPLDKWRIGEDCVATLGVKVTNHQVLLLTSYKRVIILFDSELNAQNRAIELQKRLSIYTEAVVLQTGLEGDPDDMSDDDVKHLRQHVFGTPY